MARTFEIPGYYRSDIVGALKTTRRESDPRKQDRTPSVLNLGPVSFKIARHFGFCYGVENAIEIAYRAIAENQGRRVFLLSEMIHNPHVNADLLQRGVKFILTPNGEQLVPFSELNSDDIVIVPAFGTTLELFAKLRSRGIDPLRYNATCPFVEKVWKRAAQLGEKGFSVIIHGKHTHEETRATFSHAEVAAPSLVIRDQQEAEALALFIEGARPIAEFSTVFAGQFSLNFRPENSLARIGVVNQTTMLASETLAISQRLKEAMRRRYGDASLGEHFADTRDTLCYATSENQEAIFGLTAAGGDLAIVVGGYNSSNTSHLVELLEAHVPTFYIKDAAEILSGEKIRHLHWHSGKILETGPWLPVDKSCTTILISAGASCPDALVDQVIQRVASFFSLERTVAEAVAELSLAP